MTTNWYNTKKHTKTRSPKTPPTQISKEKFFIYSSLAWTRSIHELVLYRVDECKWLAQSLTRGTTQLLESLDMSAEALTCSAVHPRCISLNSLCPLSLVLGPLRIPSGTPTQQLQPLPGHSPGLWKIWETEVKPLEVKAFRASWTQVKSLG